MCSILRRFNADKRPWIFFFLSRCRMQSGEDKVLLRRSRMIFLRREGPSRLSERSLKKPGFVHQIFDFSEGMHEKKRLASSTPNPRMNLYYCIPRVFLLKVQKNSLFHSSLVSMVLSCSIQQCITGGCMVVSRILIATLQAGVKNGPCSEVCSFPLTPSLRQRREND